jgi:hypothetical protein
MDILSRLGYDWHVDAKSKAARWAHLQALALRISTEFTDAVFIGGIAVYYHAKRLGSAFAEMSHDGDFYLSITGKGAMRDRYEMHQNRHLGKDSAIIEGEDMDVYVEHQHRLGIPYDAVASFAEEIEGVRVAALEHLLVLKLDAAADRFSTSSGQKDIRDLAKIVALLSQPRHKLLGDLMTDDRRAMLRSIVTRRDLGIMLGLNAHDGKRFGAMIVANYEVIVHEKEGPSRG